MAQLEKAIQLEGKNNSTGGENNSTGGEKQLNSTGGCLFVLKKTRHLLGGPEREISGVCEFFPAQVTIIKDSMISQQNWCKIDFISHTTRLV